MISSNESLSSPGRTPPLPVSLVGFVGVRQAQSQWCWAAAAASIYNYFAAKADPPGPEMSQCEFVTGRFLGYKACLQDPRPQACVTEGCANPTLNVPSYLNWELDERKVMRASINCDGTDQVCQDGNLYHGGFDGLVIKAQIDDGCPVALRVLLRVEDGVAMSHFLVITGYDPASLERIEIWDPDLGSRYITLEELLLLYGPLEQVYLTRQMPAKWAGGG